jgi:selenocysteine lyase/cysteine desulfurase
MRPEHDSSRDIGAPALGQSEAAGLKDPLGVRDDFRVTASAAYLDTPATAPLPRVVEQAGVDFIRAQAEGPIILPEVMKKTDEVRASFAALFGAAPHEVGFLYTTGEAENVIAGALGLQTGDNVVVDDLHYRTAYVLYRSLEKAKGIELRVVQSVDGRAGLEQFEPFVDAKTRLVSVAWVSNQNGYRHSLPELADLAHRHGALLYADGVQALGMFRTNLRLEGVDFVSSGTYKWLLAGFGIAPFFIREEHLERIQPDRLGAFSVAEEGPGYEYRLHAGARRFEYATLAFAPLYQLGASLEYLGRVGLGRIEDHALPLAAELHRGIADQGLEVMTPANNQSAIVAFRHGVDPELARQVFEQRRVLVSFRGGGSQVRAGVALFNNREDIERLLEATQELRSLK